MIVIDEREADAAFFAADSHFLRHVFKFALAVIAKEADTIAEADGEIGVAVVIEITGGAAEATPRDFETGCLRDVLEAPTSEIVEQAACAAGGAADEKQIGLAVTVIVEEASTGAGSRRRGESARLPEEACNRLRSESHGNSGRHAEGRAARQLCKREAALIAVTCAEWRSKMFRGDLLKLGEMLAGVIGITLALIGVRQTKFGGGMEGVDRQGLLESSDGFVVPLELGIEISKKIKGIGIRRNFSDMRERGEAFFRVAKILVGQAEVVPGVRILGEFPGGFGESVASGLQFLLGEERDAEIEAGDVELGVGGEGLLEILLRLGGTLLVQISDAERVQAVGVRRTVHRGSGFLCSGHFDLSGRRARAKKNRGTQ